MNEEQATNFDEFFGSFDTDDGYQTESDPAFEEIEEKEQETQEQNESEAEEGTQETDTSPATEEDAKSESDDEKEKNGAEAASEAEMFTIKVNKEERQVTREELISLAQKGADYDRVKKQAEKGFTDTQALTEQLAKTQQVYDAIEQIANNAGVDVPTLMDTFKVRQLMDKEGLSEKEAKERLGRLKAEEKLNALQKTNSEKKDPEQQMQERAERELKDFRKNFPEVDIASLPVEKMAEDIAAGMSMTQAYLKEQNRQQQEQIQKLNAQLKAKEQNAKNRLSSPGSASDSGTSKAKDKFDDFFSAFG